MSIKTLDGLRFTNIKEHYRWLGRYLDEHPKMRVKTYKEILTHSAEVMLAPAGDDDLDIHIATVSNIGDGMILESMKIFETSRPLTDEEKEAIRRVIDR